MLSNVVRTVLFPLSVTRSFRGWDVPEYKTTVKGCVSPQGICVCDFLPAPTALPLQSDCIEVKFNVKAAGIMLGRQGIIPMAIGFRWLRKCVYLLECGVCEWVVKSLKPYNFSFNQKQIVWMGAWWIIDLFSLKPSQMHLDPSTLFSSCWIYSQKPITRIIIVLNLNSFGQSVKIVTVCIIYFYICLICTFYQTGTKTKQNLPTA